MANGWVHTEAKREALGSTLRMTALPGSERQYLDAMGLLSGKQERGKEQNFTVDMRAFNEHTLSGKYHAFRIKNKFPIPGGAVADDFYRRALVEQNASAAKTIREKAEQRARHVDMATKVHEKKTRIALPTRIERLVRQVDEAIVEHDAHKQEAADTLVVMEGAPDEVKKVFGLIRARKVLELEEMFLQGEINVNMVEPTLYYTGLILACGKGLLTIAKMYLKYGANPNLKTASGMVALHVAWDSWLAVNPNLPRKKFQFRVAEDLVLELLKYKADPNIQAYSGAAPLHMAAQFGHDRLVMELLKRGADPSLRDTAGRLPIDVAQEQVAKGLVDRRGCIGVLNNWERLKSAHASREFSAAWRMTLDAANRYSKDMAAQAKQKAREGFVPEAGVVDITSKGGSDAPLQAAALHSSELMWGKSADVQDMLHRFRIDAMTRDANPTEAVKVLEYDAALKTLPSEAQLEARAVAGHARKPVADTAKGRGGRRKQRIGEEVPGASDTEDEGADNVEDRGERLDIRRTNTRSGIQEEAEGADETQAHPDRTMAAVSGLRGAAAHKKRLRTLWHEGKELSAPNEDLLVRRDMHEQALQLAKQKRLARLEKAQPDTAQLLERTRVIGEEVEAAKAARLAARAAERQARREKAREAAMGGPPPKTLEEKLSAVSGEGKYEDSASIAQVAVRGMKSRMARAAAAFVTDATEYDVGASRFTAPTGEVYVRRPAAESLLNRPSRFRADNRAKVGSDEPIAGALSRAERLAGTVKIRSAEQEEDMDGVTLASAGAVASPSRAAGGAAALALRKGTQAGADSLQQFTAAASKAELETKRQPHATFLSDQRLLPKRGTYAEQVLMDKTRQRTEAVSNAFQGGVAKASSGPAQKRSTQGKSDRKERKPHKSRLSGEEAILHYGNPAEVVSASDKPPAHGALHEQGAIEVGASLSLMDLSTLDTESTLPTQELERVSSVLGVARTARPAQYGVRRAVQHTADEPPSFADSVQLRAWRRKQKQSKYDLVSESRKQWHKGNSMFGRPEEPWRFATLNSLNPQQRPEHDSKRPPRGFKRIKDGEVIFL